MFFVFIVVIICGCQSSAEISNSKAIADAMLRGM